MLFARNSFRDGQPGAGRMIATGLCSRSMIISAPLSNLLMTDEKSLDTSVSSHE